MHCNTFLHEPDERLLEHEGRGVVVLILHNIPNHIFNGDDLVIYEGTVNRRPIEIIIYLVGFPNFIFIENGEFLLEIGLIFVFV